MVSLARSVSSKGTRYRRVRDARPAVSALEARRSLASTASASEIEPKKREAISFMKERFMSEKGAADSVILNAGVTLTQIGQMGEMNESRSGGVYKPLRN